MGIFDKARDAAENNPELAEQALQQGSDAINERTGGQFSEQVGQGRDFAEGQLGLGGDNQGNADAQPEANNDSGDSGYGQSSEAGGYGGQESNESGGGGYGSQESNESGGGGYGSQESNESGGGGYGSQESNESGGGGYGSQESGSGEGDPFQPNSDQESGQNY